MSVFFSYYLSNLEIPGLKTTWIGEQVIKFSHEVEKFIISNPRIHHFVDTNPATAALLASALIWIVVLIICHIFFSIYKRTYGNPWQLPQPPTFTLDPEFEDECRRKLENPVTLKQKDSTTVEDSSSSTFLESVLKNDTAATSEIASLLKNGKPRTNIIK